MSKAQQNNNYREKLKADKQKYEEFCKKRATNAKEYRKKLKDKENHLPADERKDAIEKRRKATLISVQKSRAKNMTLEIRLKALQVRAFRTAA